MSDQTQVQTETAPPPETERAKLSRVAKEVFGRDFHEAEQPVEETVKRPEPDDAKKGEEVSEPEGEQQPEVAEPEEGATTAAEEDTGETPIATVSELLEHLKDADPKWFNALKMSFAVDGTPTEATIGDLVESYQIAEAARNRLEDAKRIAQKESEAWASKQAEFDRQLASLGELVKYEEAKLESDVKAIPPNLRDEDPAEWAARIAEFGQRRNHIEKLKADGVAKWQANMEARKAEAKALIDRFEGEQKKVLLQKIPEWQDDTKADEEKGRIKQYLLNIGFAPEELDIKDHRMVLVARDAMRYGMSRAQADAAKKRVATVPKVMKPGAPKAKEQLASERLAALKDRVKTNSGANSESAALAYILAKRGITQ